MKLSSVCSYSAILWFSISIPALAQVSVTGGNRDMEPAREVNLPAVDEKLKAAADMMHAQPPDYNQAIAALTEASQMAPEEDAVWYRLGVAYLESANAQDDAAGKAKRSTEAYNALKKAIDVYTQRKVERLKEQSTKGPCNVEGVCTHVEKVKTGEVSENHKLAVYYSNLGDAAARVGKDQEASRDFQQAAQLDPADAGTYYFVLGIILRNGAKTAEQRKEAVEAFDKAIAADPNKAANYYLKGEVLFGMITIDDQGKVTAPAGTTEALQKYLTLEPHGPYVERAKGLLAALNKPAESENSINKGATKQK
jgi:tetratricopeptide (TPR) repeat protein